MPWALWSIIAAVPVRDDGGLDQGGSEGRHRKWTGSGSNLQRKHWQTALLNDWENGWENDAPRVPSGFLT